MGRCVPLSLRERAGVREAQQHQPSPHGVAQMQGGFVRAASLTPTVNRFTV